MSCLILSTLRFCMAAIMIASAAITAGEERPCAGVAPFISQVISKGKMAAFTNVLSARLEQAGFRVIGWDDIVRVIGEKCALADLTSGVVSKRVRDAAGAADIAWIVGGSLTKAKNGSGLAMTCWIRDISGNKRPDSVSMSCSGDDPAVFLLTIVPAVADRMSAAIKKRPAGGKGYLSSMVFVPGGECSPSGAGKMENSPVFVAPFYIGIQPVTETAFYRFIGLDSISAYSDTTPVYQISWYDAALYCNALSKKYGLDTVYGYTEIRGDAGSGCFLTDCAISPDARGFRLPTRAEWEKTFCMGGTSGVRALDTAKAEWTNDAADAEGRVDKSESTDPRGSMATTVYRIVKGRAYVSECHENVPFNPRTTRNAIGFRVALPVR